MLRKHASLIIAVSLVLLVAAACIVRTRPVGQRSQPVYSEKHKKQKHVKHHKQKKHKKHR